MRHLKAIVILGLFASGCQVNGSSVETAAPATTTVAASAEKEPPILVTAICGDCHAVKTNEISPNPQAPGFADIANSPGVTRETLVDFLSDAHNYPMQMDVDLVEEDIELIADYMLTLQDEDYHRLPS
ncbi:hypothetical protein [Qipengyuania gelatinilytica]|uniref:Cytochrome c domain-containing protein n=1 Tax=Qipengyuania gelatinilytica TaxID=2867231 RepID=A0ABX9A436_9SPHN|nr:hypothetical protein [Qipengyuania gelatinilytica]QZD94964.1 hypothetical protein K3136_12940 [Qipengyuania gelatinilytica]